MSVAVLKADNEVGYWEYSVRTEEDEWTIEFSRTEYATGTEHTDHEDMWRMHMNLKRNGEAFFNSWGYENYPFLTNHELNGLHAAAAVASLAYWYTASAKGWDIKQAREKVQRLIGEIGDVQYLMPDGTPMPNIDTSYFISEEDCLRLGPHDKTTHALYLELHHYGMATTSPEWRTEMFGKADIEPAWWGRDCDHEHE